MAGRKEVTAVINARITMIYEVDDENKVLNATEWNKKFKEAAENKELPIFDDIEAIGVKNFVADKT